MKQAQTILIKPGGLANPDCPLYIRPMTTSELCLVYGVNYRVMKKHLDSIYDVIGDRIGRVYTTGQVRKIFTWLDVPEQWKPAN